MQKNIEQNQNIMTM